MNWIQIRMKVKWIISTQEQYVVQKRTKKNKKELKRTKKNKKEQKRTKKN